MMQQIPIICSNKLFIHTQSPRELENFLERIQGHYFDEDKRKPKHPTLHSLVPIEEEDSRKRVRRSITRWGTPSEMIPLEEKISKSGQEGLLEFLTPITPPAIWLLEVARLFPNIFFRLEYEVPGTGIFGYEMRLGSWGISVTEGVDDE